MQTNLAPEFKGTPDGDEAEAILRKCVHCGFCTATCPTYQLLGDEQDGPRGRIYLIKNGGLFSSVDAKTGALLGAHMIGPEVTELLPELTLAHLMELTPHEIARNVHAHPSLSEVIGEAAHAAEGMPIHI